MKKLGVSLIAILLGLPVVAQADIANAGTVTATTNTDVATTSFVAGAYNAAIGEINTSRAQINANTTAIAAKQAQLVNDAGTPANIGATVKTTVAAAASASDTALVTEKAVRTAVDSAITAASYDDTALSGRVSDLETAVGDTTSGLVKDVADNASDISNLQTAVAGKADSATTLAGYGITDAYTKTETDTAITNGSVQTVTAGTANGTISVDGGADVTVYNDTAISGRVTALETAVGDATSGLVKDVDDLQTDVAALQTASTTAKGFDVYGNWATPTVSTGRVTISNNPVAP